MLAAGQSVDRYTVEGVIGTGGTAVVYKVRHNQLKTPHALKVLSLTSQAIRRRMLREGQVQATMRHLNVVAVTDVLDIDGAPGLLMEYVEGPSLEQALSRYRLSFEQSVTLFRGIVAGVRHAHQYGLVHRDLKPANVLLARTTDGYVPKVTDFGLAKVLQGESPSVGQTRSGVAMGTPAYMAPEQIRDAGGVDQRADVFSLGCLLYELAAGARAFPGNEALAIYNAIMGGDFVAPKARAPDIPQGIDLAIRGALIIDVDQRIPDCDTLLAVMRGEQSWQAPEGSLPPDLAEPSMSDGELRPPLVVALRGPVGNTPGAPPLRTTGPDQKSEALEVSGAMRVPEGPIEGSLVDNTFGDTSTMRRSWGWAVPIVMAIWLVGIVSIAVVGLLLLQFLGESAVSGDPSQTAPVPVEAAAPASTEPAEAAPTPTPPPEPAPAPPAASVRPSTPPAASEPRVPTAPPKARVAPPADVPPSPSLPTAVPLPSESAPPPPAPASTVTVKLFSSPRSVQLKIDGKDRGRTPSKVELPVGQHVVSLASDGKYANFPISVVADGGNRWCYSFETREVYLGSCPR